MKKYYFVFSFAFMTTTLFAQNGWFPLKTAPISKQFTSIYFINADTGFVSAYDIGNFRTTDGGVTWTSLAINTSYFKFFNNNKFGFTYPRVYKTTDDGFNWVDEGLVVLDIEFPSDAVGYSAGLISGSKDMVIRKTLNGGKNWIYNKVQVISPGSTMSVVNVHTLAFRDNEHGFVAVEAEAQDGSGGTQLAFSTSDGGISWENHGAGGDQLLFLHDSTWIRGDFNSPLIKTNDDFKTYRYLDSGDAYAIAKCDTNNILGMNLYSGVGQITRSTDAGESWHIQFSFINGPHDIRAAVSLPTKLVGYAVGVDSQIYKTIDGGGPPFINEVNTTDQYSNINIHPNPTTGILTISGAPENLVNVSVVNVLGETVAQIPHPHSASFKLDLSQQPTGTYFFRFATPEGVVVRKIIKE